MTRRRILWSVIVVTIVAIVAIGVDLIARTISLEGQRTLIEQELSEALGEPVRINGHYYLDFVPSPRIEAADITVGGLLRIGGGRARSRRPAAAPGVDSDRRTRLEPSRAAP